MSFTVTSVTDGDTFEVTPNWEWDDHSDNRVRPTGYDTPEEGEEGYDEAKEWLTKSYRKGRSWIKKSYNYR